jgi:hypothetical protein
MDKYVHGQTIYDGYNILDLLKQRLYIHDQNRKRSIYNKRDNMIAINQDGSIIIGEESFNIISGK